MPEVVKAATRELDRRARGRELLYEYRADYRDCSCEASVAEKKRFNEEWWRNYLGFDSEVEEEKEEEEDLDPDESASPPGAAPESGDAAALPEDRRSGAARTLKRRRRRRKSYSHQYDYDYD